MSFTDASPVIADAVYLAAVERSQTQLDGEELPDERAASPRRSLPLTTYRQRPAHDGADTVFCQGPLDQIRAQRRSVFRLIARFQDTVAEGGNKRALFRVVGELAECVKTSFAGEEHWLQQAGHRRYAAERQTHRQVLEELYVFHDALAQGAALSALDLAHGLDSLLMHYALDDLFGDDGLAGPDKLAASKRSGLR